MADQEYHVQLPDGTVVKVRGPSPPSPEVLKAIGARVVDPSTKRLPVITNPLAVLSTPGAATAAAFGSLLDRPGDLRAAGRAAYGEASRAPFARSVGDVASVSGEMQQRGVPLTPSQSLLVDLMMPDPTSINPAGDLAKVGTAAAVVAGKSGKALKAAVAAERAALKGEALGSLAKTLRPTETKAVYELVEPTVERVSDIYKIGRALPTTSNWAGSAADELIAAFGGDREAALRWARIWGATSPNTSVPRNTQESVSALIYALEHPGQPMTVEMAQNLSQGKITMAPSKVPNLNRALTGEPLSGDKVEAMAGFMTGEPRIPLDVHALYAVGSARDKLQPELPALRALFTGAEGLPLRGGLTETDLYLRYEDALRRALQDLVPGRSVNQVFAELWEGARAHKGLKIQGGPIDILRKKGLLEAGAMLDPERLRAALRQQGWTAGAIAGLLAALGASGTTSE